MSDFDWNTDPESLAARCAELALEQYDRLRVRLERDPEGVVSFYSEPFEVGVSNHISSMLCGYAVLKGYVTLERAKNGL